MVRKFRAAGVGGQSSPVGSAGFRDPILAEFGKRPTNRSKGQTQHHVARVCRNMHKQRVGGLSCESWRGHVGTTCTLTRRGSQALVRMHSNLSLPMHTVHSSRGRELSAGWAGSRGFPWLGSRLTEVTEQDR